MRTTLELDDDVLQAARELASLRRTSIGKVVSELLRRALQPGTSDLELRNGVPLLPPRRGAAVVTLQAVNQLRDES